MRPYKIEAGTAQHIGNRPQQNDRAALYTAARAPGYAMAVLADGGGGAIAAEQLLQTAKQLFDDYRPGEVPDLERLDALLRHIALETHELLRMNPIAAKSEPQSTMVVLILTPAAQAVWAHVGDSRLYRFHAGRCVQRSDDAAYIAHLVADDGLTPEAAARHRSSRLLGNVLGSHFKPPYVTLGRQQGLQAGDAFLLCSDGLWQLMSEQELAAVLARHTPRQSAELLINKALERARGKADNCTMAIVRLVAPPPP